MIASHLDPRPDRLAEESLAGAWNRLAAGASVRVRLICGIVGAAGMLALRTAPDRWLSVALAMLVVGVFALAATVARLERHASSRRARRGWHALRTAVNVLGALLALAVAFAVLGVIFGGSVGIMRV